MTATERATLRQLYNFRCGYCGVSETDVGAVLTTDHFQPTSRGGADAAANWVYCCFACNTAKGDYWQPDSLQRILHPLHDHLSEHILEQEDGTLLGLTSTGHFHIVQLRLNRPALVAYRLEKRRRERESIHHTEVLQRLAEAQRELHFLRQRLEQQLGRE
jgi:HNH endonuclease